MASKVNGKTDSADVAAQIETIRADVAALTALLADMADQKKDELKGTASKTAKDMRDKAKDQVTMARVRAAEAGETVRDGVEDRYARAEDAVRRQPAMAVGIAASVGFLVGLLASRR